MYKKKFFFIVFEGIEGTGKSFQIKKLYNNLLKKKYKVIKTREPGGSKTAETIRKLIFNKSSSKLHKLTDYFLMLAARNEHYNKTLLQAKKNKLIVISDRFTDSTYAYQVVGNKIDNKINIINKKYILGNFKPNLTIILKSNFHSINKRLKQRKIKNKFDKLKENFYTKVQNAFLNIAKKNKHDYKVFESSNNNNKLEVKILHLVLERFINEK